MNTLGNFVITALDHPGLLGISTAGFLSFVWLVMATQVAMKMAKGAGQGNGAGVAAIAFFSTAIFMTITGFGLYYIGQDVNVWLMLATAVGLLGLMVIVRERVFHWIWRFRISGH